MSASNTTEVQNPVHIYFLLDRSGSMESIRSDVIGGFNAFLAEQQQTAGECVMTLAQFDTQSPLEVLTDALPIARVRPLSAATFVPRAGTPLYDAMGHCIANATIRAELRDANDEPAEDILFVTFTDGQENSSREYDRQQIFSLVKTREDRGWTFVYLGANQDAYDEGGKVGYAAGSSQPYLADAEGTAMAFRSVSQAATGFRGKGTHRRRAENTEFFEGQKEAEEDLKRRGR
jgi:Mg-chelatase subunit ChlD